MTIEEFCFKLLGFINLWWEKKVAPTGCKMTKEFWIEKQIELIAADLRDLIDVAVREAFERHRRALGQVVLPNRPLDCEGIPSGSKKGKLNIRLQPPEGGSHGEDDWCFKVS